MLFRAAIGPINTEVYLPIFTRFEASGHTGLSWNWAASLYTLNWLVFRGLWGAALTYLALLVFLPLFCLSFGRLVWHWSDSVEYTVLLTGVTLFFGVPGVIGNAIYYRATRQQLKAALAALPTLEQACASLVSQSSSRQRFIRILVANAALLCLVAPVCVLILTKAPPAPQKAYVPVVLPQSAPVLRSAELAAMQSPVNVSAPAPAGGVAASIPVPMVSTPAQTVPVSKKWATDPASSGHFYVNVGLFADAANAQNAHNKVKAAGLPVLSQSVQGKKGPLTRVRVGPFANRSKADEAARRIKALALDAVVVSP